MIEMKELLALKGECEHEKIFVEAKLSVIDSLIQKELDKEKEVETENETVEDTVV